MNQLLGGHGRRYMSVEHGLFDLLANARQVHVGHTFIPVIIVPPYLLDELLTAQHAAAAACQRMQQLEFQWCQFNWRIILPHLSAGWINTKATKNEL